jgi:hypothetical protein
MRIKINGIEHQKSADEIKAMLASGQMTVSDHIYDEKYRRWTAIGYLPEFAEACREASLSHPQRQGKPLGNMQTTGLFSGLLGIVFLVVAATSDTTVCRGSIGCVHNVGLVSRQQNNVAIGCVFLLAGVVLYVGGRDR